MEQSNGIVVLFFLLPPCNVPNNVELVHVHATTNSLEVPKHDNNTAVATTHSIYTTKSRIIRCVQAAVSESMNKKKTHTCTCKHVRFTNRQQHSYFILSNDLIAPFFTVFYYIRLHEYTLATTTQIPRSLSLCLSLSVSLSLTVPSQSTIRHKAHMIIFFNNYFGCVCELIEL